MRICAKPMCAMSMCAMSSMMPGIRILHHSHAMRRTMGMRG